MQLYHTHYFFAICFLIFYHPFPEDRNHHQAKAKDSPGVHFDFWDFLPPEIRPLDWYGFGVVVGLGNRYVIHSAWELYTSSWLSPDLSRSAPSGSAMPSCSEHQCPSTSGLISPRLGTYARSCSGRVPSRLSFVTYAASRSKLRNSLTRI